MPRNRIVRRPSGFGRRSPGRLTEWFGDPFQTVETALPANTFIVVSSLTAAGLAKRPFTITRTVGNIFVRAESEILGTEPFGAIGFIVVSDKAVATGPTALPDPITQEGSDEWFTYLSFAAGGSVGGGAPLMAFPFDSRAQRKVQDGEDIAVMVSNASVADAMQFIVKFRLLIKVT